MLEIIIIYVFATIIIIEMAFICAYRELYKSANKKIDKLEERLLDKEVLGDE